jgi:hypothetical protein
LRVSGDWILRRMFRPKKEEVTRDWRELHDEKLHSVYSTLHTVRMRYAKYKRSLQRFRSEEIQEA